MYYSYSRLLGLHSLSCLYLGYISSSNHPFLCLTSRETLYLYCQKTFFLWYSVMTFRRFDDSVFLVPHLLYDIAPYPHCSRDQIYVPKTTFLHFHRSKNPAVCTCSMAFTFYFIVVVLETSPIRQANKRVNMTSYCRASCSTVAYSPTLFYFVRFICSIFLGTREILFRHLSKFFIVDPRHCSVRVHIPFCFNFFLQIFWKRK